MLRRILAVDLAVQQRIRSVEAHHMLAAAELPRRERHQAIASLLP
jgi:hypothetical protein